MPSHAIPRRRRSSRRTFVKGLAVGGAAAGLGLWRTPAFAQGNPPAAWTALSGTDFDLRIGETPMNFTGHAAESRFTVNGSVPAPTLRWKEGDTVTLRVANTLDEDASIHWHGIVLPANMDGVPGLSFHGIRPGETYVYRFKVRQGGHVLVPQPLRIPGAARAVRAARDRAARAGAVHVRPRTRRDAHGLDRREPGARLREIEEAVRLLQLPPAHRRRLLPGRSHSRA